MSTVILGRTERAAQRTDDYVITEERARCLAELIGRPETHIHRFVEKLSFKPGGGQNWQRDLQILIPGASTQEDAWWVVPLGPFRRRRFADITVTDAAGCRLNFVTRIQHGTALTKAALNKHLTELEIIDTGDLPATQPTRKHYATLRKGLFAFYTKIGKDTDREEEASNLVDCYSTLLEGLGFVDGHDGTIEAPLKAFSDDLAKAADTTQYLCWLKARPGDVVNLHVSHSTRDPQHKLESSTPSSFIETLISGVLGPFSRAPSKDRRNIWNRWYLQFGLSPILYAFNIPTYSYTTSYYSTIDPPRNTAVAYLDWEKGNNWDSQGEVDSSLDNVHIFREDGSADPEPLTTRAYLRCTPHQHKLLLGTAAMSLVLVILVAVGRFPSNVDDALQAIVTGAPSVLIAYLAYQQRHYYANVLRWMRGVLWTYLSIEVLFLVAVAFSHPVDEAGTPGLSWKATSAAVLLGTSSVALFVWQLSLGQGYERAVRFLKGRIREEQEQAGDEGSEAPRLRQRIGSWLSASRSDSEAMKAVADWQCYELAVEQYCRLIRRALVVSVLITITLLWLFWHPAAPESAAHHQGVHAVLVEGQEGVDTEGYRDSTSDTSPATLTSTSSPSW